MSVPAFRPASDGASDPARTAHTPASGVSNPTAVSARSSIGGASARNAIAPRSSTASRTKAPPRSQVQTDDARVVDQMRTVLSIAERLTKTLDRHEIFQTIVTELIRELRVDVSTIRILREDRLEVVACAGLPSEIVEQLPVFGRSEGWFGEILETGQPWIDDDVHDGRHDPTYRRYDGVLDFASSMIVPLVHHDHVIGALSAATFTPRHWTQADIEFTTALATHASIAIHNAELFERTEAWAARLSVLQATSARMNRQNSVESVGRVIVEETHRIIDYHNCRVYLIEEPDDVVPIAFMGRLGQYEMETFDVLRVKLGEGLTGSVAAHGKPILTGDAASDPRAVSVPGTDDVDESMLVVPMRYEEQVIGVITLSKLGRDQFDEDDLRLLTILADQAAAAVESARLLTQSRRLTAELRGLLNMGSALSASLDPRQVAALIAQHIVVAIGVDGCAISYYDRTADKVATLGYYPPSRFDRVDEEYALADFPATRRVLDDQTAAIVDVDDPTADPSEVALLRAEGGHTLAMLPLVAKGESIGLVEVFSNGPFVFDESRLALARTMANEAAMALENAQLYEAARKLADHDQLTGFFNHRYFHERLGEEIVRAQRSRAPLGLLMIDLDDFKLVNDTFGHLFGDRVLVWSGELIRGALRVSDVAARYGGDEFAIILPDADLEAAQHAAQRILAAFEKHAYQGEARGPVPMAASIGVASFPHDGRTGQELIAAADKALYMVKGGGGSGAEVAAATRTTDPSFGDAGVVGPSGIRVGNAGLTVVPLDRLGRANRVPLRLVSPTADTEDPA